MGPATGVVRGGGDLASDAVFRSTPPFGPQPKPAEPAPGRWRRAVVVLVVVLALAGAKLAAFERQGDADAAPTAGGARATPPALALPRPSGGPAPVVPGPKLSPRAERRAARRARGTGRAAPRDLRRVPAAKATSYAELYRVASEAFGVNRFLLASVHAQETAFSTAKGTYKGLNFADCCAGPMQFNVTNGGPGQSTWGLYKESFRKVKRLAVYPHRTKKHPSVYDDFDAMTAAAALLRDNGAGAALDGASWRAAYLYYGRDLNGVAYASQVLGRAIGWNRRGFCPQCAVDQGTVAALDAQYGEPERRLFEAAEEAEREREAKKRAAKRRAAERRAERRREERARRREAARAEEAERERERRERESSAGRPPSSNEPSRPAKPTPAPSAPAPAPAPSSPPPSSSEQPASPTPDGGGGSLLLP